MLRGLCLVSFLLWSAGCLAQQPPDPPPVAADTPPSACKSSDALCILAERLKKKDPGIGSRSGTSPGFIAKQPPNAVIPGGKLDIEFLREYKS